jgi:hypothetical protein
MKQKKTSMPPIIPAVGTAATTAIPLLAIGTGYARDWVMGTGSFNRTATYSPVNGRSVSYRINPNHYMKGSFHNKKNYYNKGGNKNHYYKKKSPWLRVWSKKAGRYVWVRRKY